MNTSEQPAPTSRWRSRIVLALLILLCSPWLYRSFRVEIGKWYIAASEDATYHDHSDRALALAQKALAWAPDNATIQNHLAMQFLRAGDAKQAAQMANQALENCRQTAQQQGVAGELLCRALNQSAYAHALAQTELPTALANIDQAIEIHRQINDRPFASPAGWLDTRGYLRLLLADAPAADRKSAYDSLLQTVEFTAAPENTTDAHPNSNPRTNAHPNAHTNTAEGSESRPANEAASNRSHEGTPSDSMTPGTDEQRNQLLTAALRDMEQAVNQNELYVKLRKSVLAQEAKNRVDHLPLIHEQRVLQESRAVLFHHRGLVHAAIGNTEAADKDLKRAKQLGYDPANGVW